MSDIDAQRLAERIDTVLDILVAGDYHSAIHNLEILKAELLNTVKEDTESLSKKARAPWEI
ncbi:hypothetical protein P2H57_11125 [Citrobacter freundii]|uniref:UPF0509 protein DJ535_20350 n=1 Tax=Citrobacter murliniae TaxID=67829 RepID=A0ABY2PS55_9ENTR|nr:MULTISPECIES: hypothetical protein [Citrobacter]MCQ7058431.1 hypothetical protein [Escherichia coli]KLV67198.1 hypothetical protein SK36_01920 [Citrobacter sp. MGH106]MBJ9598968.1 hypothetical protein [Citrobacter werkmanii]MBJ9872347.1 hypothetical protein [Citrobacter werkmanii]MDK2359758.1 hypothetical protein [Citrobacter freundii]